MIIVSVSDTPSPVAAALIVPSAVQVTRRPEVLLSPIASPERTGSPGRSVRTTVKTEFTSGRRPPILTRPRPRPPTRKNLPGGVLSSTLSASNRSPPSTSISSNRSESWAPAAAIVATTSIRSRRSGPVPLATRLTGKPSRPATSANCTSTARDMVWTSQPAESSGRPGQRHRPN
jgi:hypothetical protein